MISDVGLDGWLLDTESNCCESLSLRNSESLNLVALLVMTDDAQRHELVSSFAERLRLLEVTRTRRRGIMCGSGLNPTAYLTAYGIPYVDLRHPKATD